MSLLEVRGLCAGYGAANVLHNVNLSVEAGEIVVVLGANGAGKTTTMRAISGVIKRRGQITFRGIDISRASPDQVVREGIAQVPQGRGTIVDLTVEENLKIGAYTRKRVDLTAEIDGWFDIFPRLAQRRHQKAGLLSGGEQQMLALARAMMSDPELLLCDEPSLGLAPLITQTMFETLHALSKDRGMSVLLVEQNAALSLDIASRGYVLEAGALVAQGAADALRDDADIQSSYLGH